ncbi:hypothetical protein DSO57_1027070 [Entomophthora muscae]|uniref:Uncharacterized protein n=1 Tax=Entomophthora muscae TaxID=34485 RepID=A0ACC2TNQ3_9FUNG|nr:hypothetical protein DSO57_1027070 [Entomophthora muscae]
MKFISCAAVTIVGALATDGNNPIEASNITPGKCWASEDILGLLRNNPLLKNETGGDLKFNKAPLYSNRSALPTEMRYASWVNPLMEQISKDRMKAFVTKFSSFYNRMCLSENGAAASKWLKAQIQNSTTAQGIQIEAFPHRFPQQSIIARFPGADPALANQVVIVGSHIDTINIEDFLCGPSPGADDNASGAAVTLEAFRILAASGFSP